MIHTLKKYEVDAILCSLEFKTLLNQIAGNNYSNSKSLTVFTEASYTCSNDTEFKLTSTDRIQMTFLFVSAGIFCFFKIGFKCKKWLHTLSGISNQCWKKNSSGLFTDTMILFKERTIPNQKRVQYSSKLYQKTKQET